MPEASELDSETKRRLVRDGYDEIADDYLKLVEADSPDHPRRRLLRDVLHLIPPHSSVLDLGCGPALPVGRDVVGAGHHYTGLDISHRQIELARARVPEGTYLVGDATEARFEPGQFDAVLMLYAVTHVPREQWPELLGRCHTWLADVGVLLLNAPVREDPGWLEEDFLGTTATNWTNGWDAKHTRHLLEDAGFDIANEEILPDDVADEGPGWAWLIALKGPDLN